MKQISVVIIFIVVSIFAFITEASILSFPVTFFLGAFFLFLYKKIHIYILVFVGAFIMDALRVVNFGYTPLFLLATISMIYLYEKYSGSNDFILAALLIFASGFIYTHFMHYSISLTMIFYLTTTIGYFGYNYLKKRSF